jgi:hypothetical protein
MGFGLRYVPALDLGSLKLLRELGVDRYLADLQRKYPKWKQLENLTDKEIVHHAIPRNLQKNYWSRVEYGDIAFPTLPGQWMAVETVNMPSSGEKYAVTPVAERLEFQDNRFNVSWNDAHSAIEREKGRILSDIGVSGESVDIRFLEAIEWNLLGNREGWGKTNRHEWTNTEYHGSYGSTRLFMGTSFYGGAGYVGYARPSRSYASVGFRAAVVLGS